MKVLIVNSYCSKGGASRAAIRLYEALNEVGVDSEYISVYPSSFSFFDKMAYYARVCYDRLPGVFSAKKKIMFSSGGMSNRRVVEYINNSGADIVHLHWLNAGAISFSDLLKIDKKIVWSLHDMWLFTGGCHYDQECGAYKNQCGSCPQLASGKENDLSRTVLLKKAKYFQALDNLMVVGLSRWMTDCALSSSLLSEKKVINLPNPIDTNKFKPMDKKSARKKLGLPENKTLVLFGAMSYQDDSRKGYDELIKAFVEFDFSSDIELITFGGNEGAGDFGFPIKYLGNISNDQKLVLAYSAADILVSPSLQENLSNVIMESLSCGTPVVCFDIGGNGDMVNHKVTGYLAKPYQPIDLANGIRWLAEEENLLRCSKMARMKVVDEFDYTVVGSMYATAYEEYI